MSRERSCFEHKGMPLAQASAARGHSASAPWLRSFGVQPVPGADPMKAFPGPPIVPAEPQMFDIDEGLKTSGARSETNDGRSEAGNTTSPVLQRSPAGEASHAVHSSRAEGGAQQFVSASGVAETVSMERSGIASTDASFSLHPASAPSFPEAPAKSSGLPVGVGAAVSQIQPARQSSPVTDLGQPHVTVRKHVRLQQVISPVSIHPAASVSTSHMQPVEQPVAMTGEFSKVFHTESVVRTFAENDLKTSSPDSQPMPVTQTGEMGAAHLVQSAVSINMPALGKASKTRRTQDELLERLNEHSPHHDRGRRVHIRNLHVTVQKPVPQRQQPTPAAQPQAAPAAAPQTFFNPWERHFSAFD